MVDRSGPTGVPRSRIRWQLPHWFRCDQNSLSFAAWTLGYAHLRRGDLAPAAKMLELAADRSRAAGLPIVFPVAASMLASRTR
jgi:hypothetical protein